MTIIREGELEFRFAGALEVRKFDDPQTHQLSVMKAVDFIVTFQEYYLFVEVKDAAQTNLSNPEAFAEKLQSGKLETSLKYKYRDSFLYHWALNKPDKPIKYVVLLELNTLDTRAYQHWTDKIRRALPMGGPPTWEKRIVADAWVMNMETWNNQASFGSVRRVV